jgi:hypothetical protein
MKRKLPITTGGRWAGVLGILAGLLLLVGAGTAGAEGYEAPGVTAYPNAPGWITVAWQHSGIGVYWYNIERQDRTDVVRTEYGASGTFTDTNLQADTQYSYRVCAVYDFNQACSDWTSARTLSPPPPPSGGGTPSGGGATAPASQPANVQLTATPQRPAAITLTFTVQAGAETMTDRFVVLRHNPVDTTRSAMIDDLRRPALMGFAGSFTDTDVKPNTQYFYSVCFQTVPGNSFGLCSPLVSTTVFVPLPPTPTNLYLKARTPERVELAWTPNITDPYATTEFDIYRDGTRIATRVWYPVENHFFDEARPGTVRYQVCAVDHRGTGDEVQSCSADLKVVSFRTGSPVFDPDKPLPERQP